MNTLNFLIKPVSHLCNLHGSYCFYKKTGAIYLDEKTFMSEETAEVLIQKALEYGAAVNSFCWQGALSLRQREKVQALLRQGKAVLKVKGMI